MKRRRVIITGLMLVFLALVNSGCALLTTALTAGISYGIYQATKR